MSRLLFAVAIFVALNTGPGFAASASEIPVHHAIEARLDPASGRLTVVDVVTLRGKREVRFELAPWLEVERVWLDGRALEPEPEEGRLPLPDEGPHRIELHLQGVVPALRPDQGQGGIQRAASSPEGSYLLGDAAWIPALGEAWITYRLSVEVPAPYRAVATGRLAEEVVGEGVYRAVFAADHRAEPPALFAGPYEIREGGEGAIRIRTYFHPELADLAEGYLEDSARYLARFQEQIGPYPSRDFHVVSAPVPVGLGFANLTYIGRTVLPLPFIRARSLAHEVLHNWWGNGVAVDYQSGNWAEGLTTYLADHGLAADKDARLAWEMRLGWLRDYAALPTDRDAPVTRFTGKHDEAAQVVGYNKVAFIFHMLKRELGEATFARALRLLWRRQQFRVAGWSAISAAFEDASGQDLAWFFEQWLTRPGAPRLHLEGVETRAEADGYRLDVTLRQEQPAYRLTVPLRVETRAGLRHERIVLEGMETTAALVLDSEPLALRLDPEHDLFRRLLPGEAPPILRDVTLAADALTVIAARDPAVSRLAEELAERLLDGPVRLVPAEPSALEPAPLLIIGTTREVEAFLARGGWEGIPDELSGRGTSRVWSARRRDGHALLAVAADGVQALEMLLGPLPHYGNKSYLVFDGGRAIDKGTWPATGSPLSRRLDR
jgi:hypothetical protein